MISNIQTDTQNTRVIPGYYAGAEKITSSGACKIKEFGIERIFPFVCEIHVSNTNISHVKFWAKSFHKRGWLISYVKTLLFHNGIKISFSVKIFHFRTFSTCEMTCEIFVEYARQSPCKTWIHWKTRPLSFTENRSSTIISHVESGGVRNITVPRSSLHSSRECGFKTLQGTPCRRRSRAESSNSRCYLHQE